MSAEENKAVIRRWYEQGVNQGQLEDVYNLFHSDFVGHGPTATPGSRPKTLWEKKHFAKNYAMVVAGNVAVVTGRNVIRPGAAPSYALALFDLADGKLLQEYRLPGCPVQWGIAIDREGRMIVSLRNGTVLCIK